MAIDDNTLYGLTGAQVKELPGKIEAVKGKAKVLTTDDYNWPTTGTKTTVALWLLEPGIYYKTNSNVDVKLFNSSFGNVGVEDLCIVGNSSSFGRIVMVLSSRTTDTFGRVGIVNVGGSIVKSVNINKPLDNLTTSSPGTALDANQGKVLKDLVDSLVSRGAGAPTTSTVGQVGTLYEDTTNGDLYICTDATNPYVWEEVGSAGGGSTTIQTTTDGTNYSDVLSLPLAGSNSLNFPYAYPIMSDGNVQEWGYIRPVIGPQSIISAYVGGYEYDGNEDLWSGKQDARLALYSDVHDATLTIQQNGTTVDTFSANASTNKTVNIETPATFTTNEWDALWA